MAGMFYNDQWGYFCPLAKSKWRLPMNTYRVTYFVQAAGTVTETITAASEYNVRRLVEAKYPNVYVRVIDVTQLD